MKKVGIFAGSFDPLHHGHVAFALAAASVCGLNQVYFLAEPKPRNKSDITAFKHRLAMLKLGLKPYSKLSVIEVGDSCFSVKETLPKLQKRFKNTQLYLLVGSDVGAGLSKWPGSASLLKTMKLIIGQRKALAKRSAKNKIIYTNFGGITSSELRRQLAGGKLPHGLPAELHGYIPKNRLYGFGKLSAK